jgi:hypothetical protein
MICFVTEHFWNSGGCGKVGAILAGITLKFEPVSRQS